MAMSDCNTSFPCTYRERPNCQLTTLSWIQRPPNSAVLCCLQVAIACLHCHHDWMFTGQLQCQARDHYKGEFRDPLQEIMWLYWKHDHSLPQWNENASVDSTLNTHRERKRQHLLRWQCPDHRCRTPFKMSPYEKNECLPHLNLQCETYMQYKYIWNSYISLWL